MAMATIAQADPVNSTMDLKEFTPQIVLAKFYDFDADVICYAQTTNTFSCVSVNTLTTDGQDHYLEKKEQYLRSIDK
jgi:hypothetical protein